MGKEAAAAELSSTVVLAVNGKRYEAAGVAPSTSLLEFLRTQTPVRGPKLGMDLFAASGEPPLVLAASVHCAMREAIRAARKEFSVRTGPANSAVTFQMDVPATMPVVKELCGLDVVERYLESVSAAGARDDE